MNIFVGNVSRTATEDQLKALFERFGRVASARIIKDRFTGEARGFAFVEMPSDEEGQAAIVGANGVELEGRPLRVNEARPRTDAPRAPRRDFRGGSNGGSNSSGYSGGNNRY